MVVCRGSQSAYEHGTQKVGLVLSKQRSTDTDYIRSQLIDSMTSQIDQFRRITFTGDYADARKHFDDFAKYPVIKRDFAKNRQHLATNFGNIQTRLKTAGIRGYRPVKGVGLEVSALFRGYGGSRSDRCMTTSTTGSRESMARIGSHGSCNVQGHQCKPSRVSL
jgi:hypothetical protein